MRVSRISFGGRNALVSPGYLVMKGYRVYKYLSEEDIDWFECVIVIAVGELRLQMGCGKRLASPDGATGADVGSL